MADRSWTRRFTNTGLWRVFRYRDFILFSFAGWFSNNGTWLQRVGIQWLTWDLTHSYAWLGAISFINAAVIILFLPVFGTVIDRGDRLALAKLSQILATVFSVILACLTLFDIITIWLLVTFMIFQGLTEAFWTPVRMSLPPSMVPREELSGAIGLTSILFNLAQILGPALAGPIILAFDDPRTGIGCLFVSAAVLSLVYLASLYMIRLAHDDSPARPKTGFFTDFKEGILYAFTKEGLALFMFVMLATMIVMRAFRELLAGYSDTVFHQGPQGLAILSSAVGVGALCAAVTISRFNSVKGLTRIIFFFLGAGIVLQFGFALAGSFTIAIFCTAGLGLTIAVSGIGSQILVQSGIHGAMRGRVMSLWALILRGGPSIGAWAIGLASSAWDFRSVLVGATAIYAVIYLITLPKMRQLAIHLETPPDEAHAPHGARSSQAPA